MNPATGNELQSIDWDLSLSLAGNNEQLAKNLLTMFIQQLPEAQSAIKQAYQDRNLQKLIEEVHKLHGGCCYCGVPKLKQITSEFEKALKSSNQIDQPEKFANLNKEIDSILQSNFLG